MKAYQPFVPGRSLGNSSSPSRSISSFINRSRAAMPPVSHGKIILYIHPFWYMEQVRTFFMSPFYNIIPFPSRYAGNFRRFSHILITSILPVVFMAECILNPASQDVADFIYRFGSCRIISGTRSSFPVWIM